MDCSPPGFSVYGILQAKVLEWVAILFSRVSSHPRDWTQVSRIVDRFFPFWATREAHICIAISLSIHPFTDTCFHILATVNNAAVNLIMQIYFSEILLCFNISRHICWITWKLLFFFFEKFYTIFYCDCATLHSYQQCTSFSLSPDFPNTYLLSCWYPF